jgi:uncharacterized BrkB/YihY/UPF0761 family membrane protein
MPQLLRHRGRSVFAYVGFLVVFVIILLIVSDGYLLPALRDYNKADTNARKILGTQALLVMSAVLVLLVLILSLIFRLGRHFFPGPTAPPTKTQYTDAWTESGKRMQPPKD